MHNSAISAFLFVALSLPHLDSTLNMRATCLLAMDRAEHNPSSPTYSGRRAPGPIHGPDPHGDDVNGDDPHDEVHDKGLPAHQERLPAQEAQDKYYKGGLHAPDLLLDDSTKDKDEKAKPKNGENDKDDNDLKEQIPSKSNKKRVSDLIPTEPIPL